LDLIECLMKNGYDGRIVPVDYMSRLVEDIECLHRTGVLYEPLYREYLAHLICGRLYSPSDAKSMIIISIPQPITWIIFRYRGESVEAAIPPTYVGQSKVASNVWRLLRRSLPEHNFIKARVPLKSLAVHSGLALYGRNNITYTPRSGSFHRLVAFATNCQSQDSLWRQHECLPRCQDCQLCIEACPTGAISKDRFLIRAERCIAFHNEKSAEHPFPKWLDPSWHNAIVGCMHCQTVCPQNKEALSWRRYGGEFDEEETEYLLRGRFCGAEASRIERKLKKVGLDLTIFPRNLRYLLKGKAYGNVVD